MHELSYKFKYQKAKETISKLKAENKELKFNIKDKEGKALCPSCKNLVKFTWKTVDSGIEDIRRQERSRLAKQIEKLLEESENNHFFQLEEYGHSSDWSNTDRWWKGRIGALKEVSKFFKPEKETGR